MYIIKEGSKETVMVKKIQAVLGLKPDGVFGPKTKAAVISWQSRHHLVADGVVGPKTLETMQILDSDQSDQFFTIGSGLRIRRYHLPQNQYLPGPVDNQYIFLHHTAGWHNPFNVVDDWARDSRGKIGTEFVIGGQSIVDGNDDFDGQIVQAFPAGGTAYHLGSTGSKSMNERSVGIELCSFGPLKNGRNYVGKKAHEDQIVTLEEEFRGYTQWHKYSDQQIASLEKLLEFIAKRDNIDLRTGLVEWIHKFGPHKAFGFNEQAHAGKVRGLLTHANVRKDKTDNFPQPELVDMLLSL